MSEPTQEHSNALCMCGPSWRAPNGACALCARDWLKREREALKAELAARHDDLTLALERAEAAEARVGQLQELNRKLTDDFNAMLRENARLDREHRAAQEHLAQVEADLEVMTEDRNTVRRTANERAEKIAQVERELDAATLFLKSAQDRLALHEQHDYECPCSGDGELHAYSCLDCTCEIGEDFREMADEAETLRARVAALERERDELRGLALAAEKTRNDAMVALASERTRKVCHECEDGSGSYATPAHICGGDEQRCSTLCPGAEQTQCQICDKLVRVELERDEQNAKRLQNLKDAVHYKALVGKLEKHSERSAQQLSVLRERISKLEGALRLGGEMGKLAAKLSVLVLGAYQRDNDAAMRAFGSNAAAHVANDLGGSLVRFKPPYQALLASANSQESR